MAAGTDGCAAGLFGFLEQLALLENQVKRVTGWLDGYLRTLPQAD